MAYQVCPSVVCPVPLGARLQVSVVCRKSWQLRVSVLGVPLNVTVIVNSRLLCVAAGLTDRLRVMHAQSQPNGAVA